MNVHTDLRRAIHRVADAAIDAIAAVDEDGIGDRYDAAMATMRRVVEHAYAMDAVVRRERGAP